jgi:hypothetical protein
MLDFNVVWFEFFGAGTISTIFKYDFLRVSPPASEASEASE